VSGRTERRHGAPPAELLPLGAGFAVVACLLLLVALIVVSLGGAR